MAATDNVISTLTGSAAALAVNIATSVADIQADRAAIDAAFLLADPADPGTVAGGAAYISTIGAVSQTISAIAQEVEADRASADGARVAAMAAAAAIASKGGVFALPATLPFTNMAGTSVTSVTTSDSVVLATNGTFWKVNTVVGSAITWAQVSATVPFTGKVDFGHTGGVVHAYNPTPIVTALGAAYASRTSPDFQWALAANPAEYHRAAPDNRTLLTDYDPNIVYYWGSNFNGNGTQKSLAFPAIGIGVETLWNNANNRQVTELHLMYISRKPHATIPGTWIQGDTHRIFTWMCRTDGTKDELGMRAGNLTFANSAGTNNVVYESDTAISTWDWSRATQMRWSIHGQIPLLQRGTGAQASNFLNLPYIDSDNRTRIGDNSLGVFIGTDIYQDGRSIRGSAPGGQFSIGADVAGECVLLNVWGYAQEVMRFGRNPGASHAQWSMNIQGTGASAFWWMANNSTGNAPLRIGNAPTDTLFLNNAGNLAFGLAGNPAGTQIEMTGAITFRPIAVEPGIPAFANAVVIYNLAGILKQRSSAGIAVL